MKSKLKIVMLLVCKDIGFQINVTHNTILILTHHYINTHSSVSLVNHSFRKSVSVKHVNISPIKDEQHEWRFQIKDDSTNGLSLSECI